MRSAVSSCWLVLACVGVATAQPSPSPPATNVSTASPSTVSRHAEEGRPIIRDYRPLELGGGSQTWCILQDHRGVMYVGTNGAVLEFDGASWRRIPIGATGGSVRSLALDESGRIWVGSVGRFGYLAPDATGNLAFVQLAVPEGAPSYSDVWRTFVTKDGVLFQAERAIFRWADNVMTVI
jgi:ligand-binding sensor domain-containing protein